jgi:actin-related protein
VANRFPEEIRTKILKNIYLRGGGAKIDQIGDRITHDLRKNYSTTLESTVHITEDPVNSNYELMQKMLQERKDELQKYWITRQQFEENGDSSDIFKPFAFTNC